MNENELDSDKRFTLSHDDWFSSVIENSSALISRFLPDSSITYANQTFCKYFNTTKEKLIGKKWIDLLSENDKVRVSSIISNFNSMMEPIGIQNELLSPDGTTRIFNWVNSPVKDKNGKFIGEFQSISIDITEQKKAEEVNKANEERYKNLFYNTPIGIYRTTPEGEILLANPALIKMLGYDTVDELKKLKIESNGFYHNYSRKEFKERIAKENEIIVLETEWNKKDNSIIFARENARAFRNAEGEILYYEGTVENITEQKRVMTALEDSEKKLKESNLTKDKFISIIAHDLRSPFQGLLGISKLLIDDDELTLEERLKFESKLYNELKNQFNLLDSLLLWSRAQRGVIDFKPEKNNLISDIEESVALLNSTINKKNLTLKTELPPSLFAYYDRNMISTVIRNLISNAAKFTRPHGEIIITATINDNEVICSVKDNGIGISEENIKNLFRIDVQHSSRGTDDESGSGFGLIICNELIEKHRGKIWVESKLGSGSVFSFSIPINSNT
jgi:PAS domain S-box-containing protein